MIKKLAAIFLVLGVAVTMAPTVAQAQTKAKDAKKIQRFFTKLNQFPTAQTRPAPVLTLAKKLVRLDPRNAKRYFKTATLKFPIIYAEVKTASLRRSYDRLLDKAQSQGEISQKQNKRLQRLIARIESRVKVINQPPTPTPFPTPTPYQASTGGIRWILS